jgi:hypothetical protein
VIARRRKRVWTVSDFARHAFDDESEPACRRARRFLKRLDDRHDGKLLIPSTGTNREFTFLPSVLARLEPDLFTPVESLEFRLDEAEEAIDTMKLDQRRIVAHVGQNTKDIGRLQRARRPAA